MTVYYVGAGGNDGNSGLTWALRKLTLNGAEDVPVVAGDTVYVAPGVYRETLTVDVSGGAGTPITYIGDYRGVYTDGVGGVVRITGSDDDLTPARNNCIEHAAAKSYRTFRGFAFDTIISYCLSLTDPISLILDGCIFDYGGGNIIYIAGANQLNCTITNCYFRCGVSDSPIRILHAAVVDDSGHLISNCIFTSGGGIIIDRVGGITCKNCTFDGRFNVAIKVGFALNAGQLETVNNCIFSGCIVGLQATVLGEIIENYNSFFEVLTPRTNVAVGANSNTTPPLYDTRWFFEMTK